MFYADEILFILAQGPARIILVLGIPDVA